MTAVTAFTILEAAKRLGAIFMAQQPQQVQVQNSPVSDLTTSPNRFAMANSTFRAILTSRLLLSHTIARTRRKCSLMQLST